MNIVYLVHDFPEGDLAAGGAGNYVFNIARIMINHGHNVKVVVESNRSEIEINNGIEVHRIRATRGFRNTGRPMKVNQKVLKNIWRSLWYNSEVRKIDKKEKIDIIQSVDAYAISLFRCKGIPYVVRFSEYTPFWVGARKPVFDRNFWLRSKQMDFKLWRIAYKRADTLIAPSNLVKRLIEDESNRQVNVIESPVCVGKLEGTGCGDYNINENEYWVTFSRMTYRKSVPVIAEIIDDLLDAYPKMKYVMIGKEEKIFYKDKLMDVSDMFKMNVKRHYDRFVFTGKISNRNLLFQIVKNSYACILPTRIDNLPNSILEAMALGKIVISSNDTSAEQLIIDGFNGFLAEIDNAEDLYRKVEQVMNLSKEDYQMIGKRAKERVKDLTSDKVYEKMIEIYNETIEEHWQQ